MEKQQRLAIFHMHGVAVDHVVGVPVGEEQVDQTVIVVVEVLHAPATQQLGSAGHPVLLRNVTKRLVFVVLVNGVHFVVDVGYKKVLPAIAVDIGSIQSHARSRSSGVAESDSRLERNFVPVPASVGRGTTIYK